ncbi:MAG: choice-of-anchor X domain-containing protein, partial [Anaerolineales bacterium]
MTAERILVNSTHIAILLCGSICTAPVALSQDAMAGKPVTPSAPKSQIQSARVGSSPFTPPNGSDTTFVVDQSRGLDTGCTYRGEGPLVFSVQINRVIGDLDRLLASGMISPTAILRMPAFDVDIGADISSGAAEFNRVTLNGHLVPGEFLTGADNAWKLNVFEVPIEWINFPPDPGPGAIPTPTFNTIRIDIDVANVEEHWCTSIDWGEISVEVARPVVMVHGIRSSGATWGPWVSRLDSLGVPNSNRLDMGTLDSIGNNAVKIAAEIAGARSRWGVEKVNLIGHSKGGIDARHYAENASDVEQLIQLGTPNAGTPLADVAQSSAIVLTGFTGASMINAMAGPAGFQLTTGYMTRYNLMHGGNSNARYTAVAGDYDPDCNPEKPLCRPIDRLLLSLSGRPGDTIVSVASVHALPYADNRIHRSIGDDATAMHTEIHSNGPVFDGVVFKQVRSYRTAAPAETAVPLSRTATIGGVLQAGEIADHSFPLDQSGDLLVSLMYTDSELRLTLISPSGKIFDPKAASASDRIAFQAADILGGRMAVYAISSAEVGLWTAHVAGDFVSGTAAYGINGWIDDAEIKLRGETAGTVVPTGEPVILHAYVDQVGRPVSGAAVSALVAGPDDWTRIVDLLDDGVGQDSKADDGIYTGTLDDTSQAGLYRIAFIANRAASITEPAFSREAFGLAAVSNSASRLADRFH